MAEQPIRISRRTAIKIIGGTGMSVALAPKLLFGGRSAHSGALAEVLLSASVGSLSPDLQVFAYRRDDLLSLRFDLYNLQLDLAAVPPTLVPVSTSSPSWLVGVFSFQSIAELADQVGAAPPVSWPLTPVESLASGPSQLAFTVPAEGIPYTLASLTKWSGLGAILPAVCASGGTVAATDPTGAPTSASPPQTYIEMAWHLLVAPGPSSTWTSPASPVGDGTWTELWQAQLTSSTPGQANDLYVVWTPGYVENRPLTSKDPFNTSLTDTAGDNTYRTGLVALSSLHGVNPPANGIPAVAKTFMLTPLGVTADVQGTWDDTAGPPVPIVSWTHRMSTGRDTFVRVVEAGYLYPFGHRAVKIQTTDREFQVSPSGDTVGILSSAPPFRSPSRRSHTPIPTRALWRSLSTAARTRSPYPPRPGPSRPPRSIRRPRRATRRRSRCRACRPTTPSG